MIITATLEGLYIINLITVLGGRTAGISQAIIQIQIIITEKVYIILAVAIVGIISF